MQVVDSATVVIFRHRVDVHRPVRFKSRKPCIYGLNKVVGEERLAGTAPARFAEMLGLKERLPDTSSCQARHCRDDSHPLIGATRDTLMSQGLELTFQGSGRELTFAVAYPEEVARITDASQHWACLPLPPRTPDLVALARNSFPWDSLLTRIEPCKPTAADSAPPSPGDYVYVEELPESIERQAPKYPYKAREAGVGGTVMVQALIGRDGEVARTVIVESIPLLDQAAVQAVEQWRFRPARSNGKPVAIWVAVPSSSHSRTEARDAGPRGGMSDSGGDRTHPVPAAMSALLQSSSPPPSVRAGTMSACRISVEIETLWR
jgi:protein TonB